MILAFWKAFWKDEEGQGLVEYAIIIALIVLASIFILTQLGAQFATSLQKSTKRSAVPNRIEADTSKLAYERWR